MKFEWDEGKNQSNLIKHGFDFTDAYRIFNLPMVVELDERDNYGEDRFVAIGLLNGRVVVIVYTEPDDDWVGQGGFPPVAPIMTVRASIICIQPLQ